MPPRTAFPMFLQVYTYGELSTLVRDSVSAYKATTSAGSTEMNGLIAASGELLGAAPAAEPWLAYVANASHIVVEGLADMVLVSLKHLLAQVSRCS